MFRGRIPDSEGSLDRRSLWISSSVGVVAGSGRRGSERTSLTVKDSPDGLMPRKATILPGKKSKDCFSIRRGTRIPAPILLLLSRTIDAAFSFPSEVSEAILPTAIISAVLSAAGLPKAESGKP